MQKKQSLEILKSLKKLYPDAESELNFKNEYELVIAVSLSAQCTDKKVNEVTPALFSKYRSFKSLSKAILKDIESIIKQVNYYKTKSKRTIDLGKVVTSEFNGTLPNTLEELITLPGVGRKTASVIQSERGLEHALPVDTHVFRVSNRLGLSNGKDVLKVEEDLRNIYPSKNWRDLHHCLIFHGRRVCKAQNPSCSECKLIKLCKNPENE